MAKLPVAEENIIAKFGPHLNYAPKDGYEGRDEPDKNVKPIVVFAVCNAVSNCWSKTTK